MRWGLADQHDLPLVQMHPDQIDPAVARQVPAAWARTHLMLPVLRHGDSLIVVMADPDARAHYGELRELTGAVSIDGAVAAVETVQELIDFVFGGESGEEVDTAEWLATALMGGATELGVSVRGTRALGWSPHGGGSRHWLAPAWRQALRQALSAWADAPDGEVREWTALLRAGSHVWRVRCRLMGRGDALEWVARVEERLARDPAAITADAELRQKVALALRDGALVLRVHDGDEASRTLLAEALPLLPAALLGGAPRVAHLGQPGGASPTGVVALFTAPDPARLAALAPFALDALTLDAPAPDAALLDAALSSRRSSPTARAVATSSRTAPSSTSASAPTAPPSGRAAAEPWPRSTSSCASWCSRAARTYTSAPAARRCCACTVTCSASTFASSLPRTCAR